ncbi:hypothetical protein KPH14_004850 [Odynerus spinipes]|uniref:Protein takeout n=1 Tax=Odynerus spinipes TaxID=1348599 RepID=A0AAD9VQ31_9HYME|nr:hypothetical protein KPH14_004850 [Odynerus spinipes]
MKTIVCLLIIVAATTALDPPSNFKLCKRNDPRYSDCIADAVTKAVTSLAGGLKAFKILPLEPLAVDNIKIGEAEGSVSLMQEYKNIKLHGLTKGLVVKDYKIDFNKLILESDSFNPQVDFVADYKLNGKILLLPVRGSGKSNITMYNLRSHNVIYCEKFEKKGETYLRVKKYDIKFHPEKVTLQFDNLFNGDPVLAEPMNKFINENSDLLFKELQAPYEETFGLVFAKISNDLFTRIPMNKLFPLN